MKKPIYLIGIILLIFVNSYCLFNISKTHNRYEVLLNGNDNITVSYASDFNDEGFKALKNNKEMSLDELESYDIISNVDTRKLGEYEVTYNIKINNKEYNLKRTVTVVDDEAPEIITESDEVTVGYCDAKITNDLSYKALDNYDGDITKKVKVEEKDNKYILTVTDSNNNTATKELIKKTSDKPADKVKLNGNSTVYVPLGGTYEEQGAYAVDGCGTTIEKEIETSGSVNVNKEGNYTITYKIKDEDIKTTRIVSVYTKKSSNNNTSSNKVIYLTFDDGPCYLTPQVLDILKKYNVKATFFVTSQFSNYVNLIEREYNEGHAVGVHSLTHKWDIYDSVDAYLTDFNSMNDIIERYTGSRSKIFRFPGGASNTISRGHSKGVVTAIASRLTADGYEYFDWNVDSRDAEGKSSDQIYNNVVNGVAGSCTNCVVLMHDIHKSTVNQLDRLLATLTSKGYTFKTLDVNSPTCHHKIAN